MEGEWLCYGGGQFNGGRMVMLPRWSLMEGEWLSYGGGRFSGGKHNPEVITLMGGKWSGYRGGQFI